MSKSPQASTKSAAHARPAIWAQAMFAGSLMLAALVLYLVAAV